VILMVINQTDKKSKITGKWKPFELAEYTRGDKLKVTKNPQTMAEIEFFEDNTVLWGPWGARKWIILNDGRIKIDFGGLGSSRVLLGSLQGDTLSLTMPGEKGVMKYKRFNAYCLSSENVMPEVFTQA
jgi:hypothetical protein